MWKVYFNLNKLSPLEANSDINGVAVSISKGSKQLIVENIDAYDEADARRKALSTANQFLNGLWKHNSYLDIDPSSQHVESSSGQKRGYVSMQASVLITSQLTAVKKDPSGNIIEVRDSSRPGRIEVKPSEAAGYYRHAHLTNDPFNRFRDLYLAAENVASKIQMAKGLSKNELKRLSESGESREEGLLRLALDECFGSDPHSLKQIAKNLPDFDDAQQAIPQVAKILFRGYRCQLNHSKASENKKIPFNPEDEKEVKAALPLMEFVAKSLLQYEESEV
jgi:hypothetical protein